MTCLSDGAMFAQVLRIARSVWIYARYLHKRCGPQIISVMRWFYLTVPGRRAHPPYLFRDVALITTSITICISVRNRAKKFTSERLARRRDLSSRVTVYTEVFLSPKRQNLNCKVLVNNGCYSLSRFPASRQRGKKVFMLIARWLSRRQRSRICVPVGLRFDRLRYICNIIINIIRNTVVRANSSFFISCCTIKNKIYN